NDLAIIGNNMGQAGDRSKTSPLFAFGSQLWKCLYRLAFAYGSSIAISGLGSITSQQVSKAHWESVEEKSAVFPLCAVCAQFVRSLGSFANNSPPRRHLSAGGAHIDPARY